MGTGEGAAEGKEFDDLRENELGEPIDTIFRFPKLKTGS